jgi:hypothetical protein
MDSRKFSEWFRESIFKKIYEEIEKNLSKGPKSDLYLFLLKQGQNLANESEKFKLDYERHKTGVFLWWNEEYPTIFKFLDLIADKEINFQFSCYDNMKLTVKDYYSLINLVKILNSKLFDDELTESRELVFQKNINPIKILQKKNPLIGLINDELKEYGGKAIPHLDDYIKQITPEFKKYVESITLVLKEQISSLSNNLVKGFKGEMEQKDLVKKSSIEGVNFNELINEHSQKFQSLMKEIQKRTKVSKQDILLYSKELETSYKLIEKGIFNDNIANVRNSIMLLKDLDSFNIHFCRFINRIYHILTKNNRNYKDEPSCFLNIKPKPFNPQTRNKIKQFISGQFKTHYPNLAAFLLKGFEFNEIRKLEAHEIPDKIKLSDDKKIAFISQTGDVPDIPLGLENVEKFINSYCFFIDALGLY